MILLDYSQTAVSCIMSTADAKNPVFDEKLARHFVLNTILNIKLNYSKKFGNEVILCCDSISNWRRDVFPYYKAKRKKSRDESVFDWNKLFELKDMFMREIQETFGYRVLQVDKAEADDIIGVIVSKTVFELPVDQNILIVSSDQDFLQLQFSAAVHQYSNVKQKLIRVDNCRDFLIEKIITGDAGDGVPNMLSPDAIFLTEGTRQKPVTKKKLTEWIKDARNGSFASFDEDMKRNYERNKKLVDLTCIPEEIKSAIYEQYKNSQLREKKDILSYFMKNELNMLLDFVKVF